MLNPWKRTRKLEMELAETKGLVEELSKWRFDTVQVMTGGKVREQSSISERELINQNYGTVAFCTGLISDIIGSTRWVMEVTVNKKSGKTEKTEDHPVIELLKNPGLNYFPQTGKNIRDFDGYDLHKKGQLHLDLAGNAYLYPVKNVFGEWIQLWPLRPDYVAVLVNPNTGYLENYAFRYGRGQWELFDPWELIHLRYIHPKWEYFGASIIEQQSIDIETVRAQSVFKLAFFENDATPTTVVMSKTGMSPDDKKELRDKLESRHMGPENSHRMAILRGRDYTIEKLSVTPSDAQLLADQQFGDQRIMRAFSVPEALFSKDATYANSTNAWRNFYRMCINPRRRLWQRAYERGLLPRMDVDDTLTWKDDSPEDMEFALKEAKMHLETGVIRPDERRDEIGKEPLPDGRGDILLPERKGPPMEIMDVTPQKGVRKAPVVRKKGWQKNYAASYLKAHSSREGTMLKSIQEAFQWDLDTILGKIDNGALDRSFAMKRGMPDNVKMGEWLRDQNRKDNSIDDVFPDANTWIKNWVEIAFDSFFAIYGFFGEQGAEEASKVIGIEINWDIDQPYIKDQAKAILQTDLAKGISTTKDSLRVLISDTIGNGGTKDDVKDAIRERITKWKGSRESRAWNIARTETTAASNSSKLNAWEAAQVQTGMRLEKEWIDTGDDRTRDDHIDAGAQVVPVNALFEVGGEYAQYPGDPSLSAEQRVNCRCTHAVHVAGGE